MEAVTSLPRKIAKHVYTRDFLMSFADLEDCKKQLEGLDPVVLRDSSTDLVTGGIAVPVVSSRGLIRQDRESNGVPDGSQDVPEWRRPLSNSGGTVLQQGHRRNEQSGSNVSGNFSSRLTSTRGENASLRNSFEKTGWPGSGSYTGQSRWDHRSGLGDRERERNRPNLDRDYPESDANGHLRGIGVNSFRQGLAQHEHDGLLGSGNVLRPSSAGGLIPTHARASDRYHAPGRMGRSSEQYAPRTMKMASFSHQDKDSVNEETFGSEECSSEERSEQERQRRESFQRMRKEQQILLQEKQKTQIQEHEEPHRLDLSVMSSRKEDENIVWDGQNSETLLPSAPGLPHSVCSKDSSSKPFYSNAITTGTSLLTPSRSLVPPGFSKLAFQKQASLNGENKEDIAHVDKEPNMDVDGGWVEKTETSTFADTTLSEARVPKESSGSILDKLFGKAGATFEKGDTLPSGILLEEGLSGEEDTWSQISPKASKFAQWFHTEDDKYQDSSVVGSSSDFLYRHENQVPSGNSRRNSSTNSMPKLPNNESQETFCDLLNSHQNILSLFSKIDNQTTFSSSSAGQSSSLQSESHTMPCTVRSGSSMLPLLPKGENDADLSSSTSSSLNVLSLICNNESQAAASTLSTSMPVGNSVDILEENSINNLAALLPLQGQCRVLPMPAGPSLEDVEKILTVTDIATTIAEGNLKHGSIGRDLTTLEKNFDFVHSEEGISYLLKPESVSGESFQNVSEDLFQRAFSKPKVLPKVPPVFLTCEDLEQSMLAEVSSFPEKRMVTTESKIFSGKVVQDMNSQIDNDASQHLLTLLQKGSAMTSSLDLPEESNSLNHSVEGMLILDGTSSSQRMNQVAETIGEVKDNQNAEMQTLETLFGKAFMCQLQSMEAPVSRKTLPYYPVCSDTEDGLQTLLKNMSSNRQSSSGSGGSIKGPNDAKSSLGTMGKTWTIGFSDVNNSELCKGACASHLAQSQISAMGNGLWDNFTSQFHLDTGSNSDISLVMGSGHTTSSSHILDGLEKENSDSSSPLQKQIIDSSATLEKGIIDSTVASEDAIMDSGVAFDSLSNFNESRGQATNLIFDSRGNIGLPNNNITKVTPVNDHTKNVVERGEGPINEFVGIGGTYLKLRQVGSENVMARVGSDDTEKMVVNCFPKEHTLTSKNIVETSVVGGQVSKCFVDEGRVGRLSKVNGFELLKAGEMDGFQYHSDRGRDFPEIFGMDGDIRPFHSRSPYITSAESSIEGQYPLSVSGLPTRNRSQTSLSFPEAHHSILLSQQQHHRVPSKSQPTFPGLHFRPPSFSTPQHTSGLQDALLNLQRDDILQNGPHPHLHPHPHLQLQSMPFSSGTQIEPLRFPFGCPPNFVSGRSFSGEFSSGQSEYPSVNPRIGPLPQHCRYPPTGPTGRFMVPVDATPRGLPFQSMHGIQFLHEHASQIGPRGLPIEHTQPGIGAFTVDGSFHHMQGGQFHPPSNMLRGQPALGRAYGAPPRFGLDFGRSAQVGSDLGNYARGSGGSDRRIGSPLDMWLGTDSSHNLQGIPGFRPY